VAVGATATFTAALSGSPAPALQWQRSTDGGATWADIVGAQTNSYTTPPAVQGDDGSRYRLVAANAAGNAMTQAAQLNVIVPLSSTPAGKLAMGVAHTCAVKADYTVACWGNNNQGQLGDGSTNNASAPVAVSGLQQVIAVAVGSRGFYSGNWGQSCAVQAGGGLWCWGRDVNAVDQLVPQAMAGVTDAKAVAVGSGHACYLDGTGGVRCWGFNISGELGNGSYGNPQAAPALVQTNAGGTLTGIVDVGAGDMWSCALAAGGAVWCWGVDHTGDAQLAATRVSGVFGASALSVGPVHACAVMAGGAVRCWGFGGNGELGNGGTVTTATALTVTGLTEVTAVAAGAGHTCARRSGGDVVCWGTANLGNGSSSSTVPGAAVTDLTDVSAVAAGRAGTCALRTDGQVQCWGTNFYGQLGVGDVSDRATPTPTAAGAVFWRP
jgi:alpha-tubulin suppressor-like RCC1 family protein